MPGETDFSGADNEYLEKVVALYRTRIKTLNEFGEITDCFFRDDYSVDGKGMEKYLGKADNRTNLGAFSEILKTLEPFSHENIEKACREFAEKNNLKASQIIHPARMAISGKTQGAGLFEMMEVLGREKVLQRLGKIAA
ncbi:MAG: hypothetical protein ABH885_05300 [Candidatus Omnitrophota bacterium]